MIANNLENVPDIDLGEDHYLTFTIWAPDDLTENKQLFGDPLPRIEKFGAIIRHYNSKDKMCEGCITFDGEYQRKFHKGPLWSVISWEPLTLEPSILCNCGDHGFIRNGKWVKA